MSISEGTLLLITHEIADAMSLVVIQSWIEVVSLKIIESPFLRALIR